jgi:hypothetical protein
MTIELWKIELALITIGVMCAIGGWALGEYLSESKGADD